MVCTICTILSYELGTILCLIVTVNMEFYIIEIIAREFVLWHLLYRYSLRSSPFCCYYIFGFLSMSTHLLCLFASQICSPPTICHSFLILNWKVGLEPEPTYLSWSNMLLYNCHSCNQIMCSIKIQSFQHFLCNKNAQNWSSNQHLISNSNYTILYYTTVLQLHNI